MVRHLLVDYWGREKAGKFLKALAAQNRPCGAAIACSRSCLPPANFRSP